MKGKDITSVNKIVTNDLDVNNQIDMKNKKIANLADGTVNNDAVNKAQLISMQASLLSQITTLNNKLIQSLQIMVIIIVHQHYHTTTRHMYIFLSQIPV